MKIVSSEERYRCSLFRVTEDRARDERDGFEIQRSVIRHNGSAVMMAMDGKNAILMVRQYRLPAGKDLWELPAGRVDEGETPLQAARRELKEETGYGARHWKRLVSFFPSPGYVDEKMSLYLATGLVSGPPKPMDDERIETRWFTPRQLDADMRAGKIVDAKTIIGFCVWQRYYR
ncbi:MAG: NUDIX hydrolase [Bryobacteraceae bacterium]